MQILLAAPLLLCTPPLFRADVREHRLPNGWNATLAAGGLLVHAVGAFVQQGWEPLVASVRTGFGGLAIMWLLQLLVRGGLGFGDVKLVAALGFVFANGWQLFATVFAAFFAASIWVLPQLRRRYRRDSRVAFGPFILIGAWLMVLFVS